MTQLRRHAVRTLLALAAWAPAAVALAQTAPSLDDLSRELAPSVWNLRVGEADGAPVQAAGSAVVIGPNTLLTSCRALERARRIAVASAGAQLDARVQYADVAHDLCQLVTRELHAPAVELGDSDRLAVGQQVFVLGNPRGTEGAASEGLISALRLDDSHSALALVQTTAQVGAAGGAGAGLFDSTGKLIGITTLQHKEAPALGFGIPINLQQEIASHGEAELHAARPAAGAASEAAPAPYADANAVPASPRCRNEYRKFLLASNPKAFVVAADGRCFWQQSAAAPWPQLSASPDPGVRAMAMCVQAQGRGCALYAVDAAVVWRR